MTACLEGSIPAQGLLDLRRFNDELDLRCPENMDAPLWTMHRWKLLFARADEWLDVRPTVRYLEENLLAQVVVDSLHHFTEDRYELLAYVVMPSHFHWLFRPRDEWIERQGVDGKDRSPRETIMHSLKRFTARECNLLLGRQGNFWQDESYDHCVRDEGELARIIDYIELNPVKAGLTPASEQWPYSSARIRAKRGIHAGEAIPRRTGL